MGETRQMTWEDAVRSLIDDPAQKDLVDACYYDPPLSAAAARYAASPEWTEVRRLCGPARGIAVDIGAGNGIVSYALARDGWTVVAVEPDPSALVGAGAIRRLAGETGLSIDVRAGAGESLPLGDDEVAVIVARQVLHHARDLAGFAREIARVLAPGGVLVTLRDHVVDGQEQLQEFFATHPLHRVYGGENAFSRAEYRTALTSAGLTIEREFRSFDSVVNYAPYTRESLRAEISRRLGPLSGVAGAALSVPPIFDAALRVLSIVDHRPGRLISFLCRKV
ncbi:class I SAM-dependent methyltransferase [Methylocystis sp. H4A]|nr:class I SAM-dependent methyltransferase [Methylocystis sp. H4A]